MPTLPLLDAGARCPSPASQPAGLAPSGGDQLALSRWSNFPLDLVTSMCRRPLGGRQAVAPWPLRCGARPDGRERCGLDSLSIGDRDQPISCLGWRTYKTWRPRCRQPSAAGSSAQIDTISFSSTALPTSAAVPSTLRRTRMPVEDLYIRWALQLVPRLRASRASASASGFF